jgi:hypothetical protein
LDFYQSSSAWYILLSVLIGAVYAGLFYFREKQLPEMSPYLRYLLVAARFLVVTLISILIFVEPVIKTEKRRVEKPVIVIAQDNSQSLLLSADSTFYKNEYLQNLTSLKEALAENYEVKTYTLGSKVREGLEVNFSDETSDLGELFEELFTRYYNRNLGAVILATDGIYNRGMSPVSKARRLKGVPVFTVAMGDTTVRKDLLIGDVAFNRMAYLGNDFPVNVTVDARKCAGQKASVRITQGNNLVASKDFTIEHDSWSQVFPFTLHAKSPGIQRYTIEVTVLDGELTILNNKRDIFIEVLDSRQKVLLLAHSPHPDLEAISAAISNNMNYEVSTKLITGFNENTKKYSLVIFHQLPSNTEAANAVIEQTKNDGIPALYILGQQSSIASFNTLGTGISISNFRNTSTNAGGAFNTAFPLFRIEAQGARNIQKYPPLQAPFGDWKSTQAVNALFYQKVGSVETQTPLIAFNNESRQKTGVIGGEGIWRWRMNEYAQTGDSKAFDEIIQKSVQFLASRENKNPFRVFAKTDFRENENIVFDAELYNAAFELVNEPDVQITITNDAQKENQRVFSRQGKAYRLDAGKLPAGQYTFEAGTSYNKQNFMVKGVFTISAVRLEQTASTANHALLKNLAFSTKGEMVYPRDLSTLGEKLKQREDIVEVVYPERRWDDLLNFKWIFFLFLALLTGEWFIRKYVGGY